MSARRPAASVPEAIEGGEGDIGLEGQAPVVTAPEDVSDRVIQSTSAWKKDVNPYERNVNRVMRSSLPEVFFQSETNNHAVHDMKQLFKGCHIVFLHRQHIARMREKVTEHGGDVQRAANRETTHLVVSNDLTPEKGMAALKATGLLR